jgi:branched-chain amino acid transport system permease protein
MTSRYLLSLVAVAALALFPLVGGGLGTFLATDVAIWALFAVSLNILVGYTGLVSFGHAAYFGVGAYVAGILLKNGGAPFLLALPMAGLAAGLLAAIFGFFCVRLTKVYFSMLTLAFAQIAWALCFKLNAITGGDQGLSGIPYPDFLRHLDGTPILGVLDTSQRFHLVVVVIVGICLALIHRILSSPFGRVLTMIRENPGRAEFVGVNVHRYQLAAFVLAGMFAGLAGSLFGIFNRGMYPDLMYWTKSAEVLIMVVLGGMGRFYGPIIGAFLLLWMNQELTAITEYWSAIVGLALMGLIFFLPGGFVDLIERGRDLLSARLRRGKAVQAATQESAS